MSENKLPQNPGFKVGDRVRVKRTKEHDCIDDEIEGTIQEIDDPVIDNIPVLVEYWEPENEFGDSEEAEDYFRFDSLTRIEDGPRRVGRERPDRLPRVTERPLEEWEKDLLWAGERDADVLAEVNGDESHDPVNHPSHYTSYPGIEVIQLTEQLSFLRGNVIKYAARAGLKGPPEQELEDLKKAAWYLNREIDRLEGL